MFSTYLLCCCSFIHSIMRILLAPHRLAAPLPHIQLVSNIIHTSSFIPNKRKRHKNIKAINTITPPSLLFLVSNVVMRKHPQLKTRENVLPWNPKTSSCSHPNPKVINLLQHIIVVLQTHWGKPISFSYLLFNISKYLVLFFFLCLLLQRHLSFFFVTFYYWNVEGCIAIYFCMTIQGKCSNPLGLFSLFFKGVS